MRVLLSKLCTGMILILFVVALPAHADDIFDQLSLKSLRIVQSPAYATPGQNVRLSVEDPSLDPNAASITWTIDGKRGEAGPVKEIFVTAGKLGSETTVSVRVETDNGAELASAVIRPTKLTVLWESDSYTPPLYSGRRLPSGGTSIIAQAMPHFVRTNGTVIPAKDLIYTWRRNGRVIGGVSGLGASSARLDSPGLFASDTITVDARTRDNLLQGRAEFVIAAEEPVLNLYPSHPLYGPYFENAVPASATITDTQTAFIAIPYYIRATSPADPRLTFEWTVNGHAVPPDEKNKAAVTIAAKNGGRAEVGLSISDAKDLYTNVSRTWSLSLTPLSGGSDAAPARGDPFRQ